MNQVFNSPIEEVVKVRRSVRSYSNQEISPETKEQLNHYISTLTNPFSAKIRFNIIESKNTADGVQLGTYGTIKGATCYIGATMDNSEFALEAVGYEFEKLILFAASIGLGTCWLGGTFKRSEFAKAMQIKESEIFPAVSPVGYAEKKSLTESLMRMVTAADRRKPWETMFFNNNFTTPLTSTDAAEYALAFEMVHLAPSASNKQPWRMVKAGQTVHFYEAKAAGYSDRFDYDIQRVDIGIAACHFHLAAIEKGIAGEFKKMNAPIADLPEQTNYIFSWVSE